MSDATYEVVFDGETAAVYRHVEVVRKRWFGLRSVTTTESSVLGIYPCRMAFDMVKRINRPGELTLSFGAQKVRLTEKVPGL